MNTELDILITRLSAANRDFTPYLGRKFKSYAIKQTEQMVDPGDATFFSGDFEYWFDSTVLPFIASRFEQFTRTKDLEALIRSSIASYLVYTNPSYKERYSKEAAMWEQHNRRVE